uniref:Uncharacterized protein n=1 Tax=Lepeophtheirus salmonis TaxID=72036 RepID=A0A0K2URV0_LEPSM
MSWMTSTMFSVLESLWRLSDFLLTSKSSSFPHWPESRGKALPPFLRGELGIL